MSSPILGLRDHEFLVHSNTVRRLQRALWTAFALATALTVAAATWSSLEARAYQLGAARSQSLYLARLLEEQVAGLLGSAEQYLLGARDVVESQGGVDAISDARLGQLLASQPFKKGAIRPALVVDREGRKRWVGEEMSQREFSHREWFAESRGHPGREAHIHPPVRSAAEGNWIIPVTVRVEGPDGAFNGAIRLGIEVNYLLDLYGSLGIDPQSSIALVRSDGRFLVRYPDFGGAVEARLPESDLALLQGPQGAFVPVSRSGAPPRIAAFRRMPQHPIFVVVTLSNEKVLGRWRRGNATRALAAFGVILLLALLTAIISRRLRREADVTTFLANFARAVDRSADLLFWIRPDGRFLYANDAALKRIGCTRERITTMSVQDVWRDFPQERWTAFWQRMREHGDLRIASELVTAGGARFPIGICASHVVIGGETLLLAIARDLTQERYSEAAIQALNHTLEQKVLERTRELELANAALATFSYSVSHDLRAPLRHLCGYANALAEHLGGEVHEGGRHLLQRIGERARHMDALIEGLLGLSKVGRQPVALEELDITQMAREIARELAAENRGRHIEITIEGGLRALGDATLVRTLLQNLLGNACKYSSKSARAQVDLACVRSSGEAVFRVRDNGAGFDPDHADRLFGAFQRLHSHSEFPGSGIGLATAKRIVERHGGRIWAESAPGAGATFYFTLAPRPE